MVPRMIYLRANAQAWWPAVSIPGTESKPCSRMFSGRAGGSPLGSTSPGGGFGQPGVFQCPEAVPWGDLGCGKLSRLLWLQSRTRSSWHGWASSRCLGRSPLPTRGRASPAKSSRGDPQTRCQPGGRAHSSKHEVAEEAGTVFLFFLECLQRWPPVGASH